MNVIKESEIDCLATPWEEARVATIMRARRILMRRAVARMAPGKTLYQTAREVLEDSGYSSEEGPTEEELAEWKSDPLEYEELVRTQADVVLPPFTRTIVRGKVRNTITQGRLHVATSELLPEEGRLPLGVRFWSSYATLKRGSKKVSVLLENTTAVSVTIGSGTPLARVSAANMIPEKYVLPGAVWKLDEELGIERKPSPEELASEERKDRVLEKLDLSLLESWNPVRKSQAIAFLREFADIFALDSNELGCTKAAEHNIVVDDETPIKERFRRIPPHMVEEVREHLKVMLDAGAIAPSDSPWSNAVVLVRKKDGGLRFCIDFRRLNDRTKKDSYPLPRIQETLDCLVGAKIFSCVDFLSGFWQVPMSPGSRKYTAFTVGNLGFFECRRMPFGLCNAPATFQRCMQNVLGELNLTYCLIYLDDVIIYSETEEEHLTRLRAVFERLRLNGLRLKPSKCKFFQREIVYLAHRISEDGVRPSEDNLKAIQEVKEPATYTEIRSFTNLAGHYRRFIPKFSKIAKPLTDYLSGEGANKKKEEVELSRSAKAAFEELKRRLQEEPVLQLARFDRPFELHTDASSVGLGAALHQTDDEGRLHPVAYGSRSLTKHEKNYHSSKLEFLALLWAVTRQFKEYLYHAPFTVKTDNNPLTYVLTTANLDATGHRWVGALASYSFGLEYLKGKNNPVADSFSRTEEGSKMTPEELEAYRASRADEKATTGGETVKLTPDEVKCLLDGSLVGSPDRCEAYALADMPAEDLCGIQSDTENRMEPTGAPTEAMVRVRRSKYQPIERTDWQEAQREDPTIAATIDWVVSQRTGPLAKALGDASRTQEGQGFVKERDNFIFKDGYLYIRRPSKGDVDAVTLFVVPKKYRQSAIDGCHRNAGHQGQDRTLSLLRERFWWPGMVPAARNSVKGCLRCIKYEARGVKAPLTPIFATTPMELLHVDFAGIERPVPLNKQPKAEHVLVFTDHFTRYAFAFVTKDQTSRTVAEIMYRYVIVPFGAPARLLSDQGTCFTSHIVSELCAMLGIQKCRTSPYHAQTNGQVERMHQTIMRMIGKLEETKKIDWIDHLPEVIQAYNATRSDVTGYSPFYLMFGRRPRLPMDFFFPTIRGEQVKKVPEYVASVLKHLRSAFKTARDTQKGEAERQKKYYDRTTGSAVLNPGDWVLLRTDAFVGKRKIKDKWGDTPYTVENQLAGDIPVYRIKSADGQERTAHRNRLLFISTAEEAQDDDGTGLGPIPPNGGIHVYSTVSLEKTPGSNYPDTDVKDKPQAVDSRALVPELSRLAPRGITIGCYRGLPWMFIGSSSDTMEPVHTDPTTVRNSRQSPVQNRCSMADVDVD